MPTKEEIKANQREAKDLRKKLATSERANLKACKAERWKIRKATARIQKLEREQSIFAQKANKRLAILEGRNDA
jgi:hypothetical protein